MPTPDTEALLDALDRFRDVKGSVPLFDALAAEDPAAVAAALSRHLRHPLHDDIGAWLTARGLSVPERESLAEVAARLGITDLENLLADEAATRARLSSSLDEALARARKAEAVANAYAAVLVLLAGACLLGWLGALGVISIPRGVPEPPPERAATPSTLPASPAGR